MRIGLVCPYRLTVPGGVQGQMLGLPAPVAGTGIVLIELDGIVG